MVRQSAVTDAETDVPADHDMSTTSGTTGNTLLFGTGLTGHW